MPRVTQTPRGKEEAALNDLFSRVIRERDPQCQISRCRGTRSVVVMFDAEEALSFGSHPSTDAAHLFPKGSHPRIRWDLRNAVGACRSCHSFIDTHKAEREAFMRTRLNVQDWEDLMRIHLVGPSPDRAEVRATLTAALKQYRRAA